MKSRNGSDLWAHRARSLRGAPKSSAAHAAAAALGSLLAHALIIAPVIWGASPRATRLPDQQGAGASAITSTEEPAETLILISVNEVDPKSASIPNELSSRGFAPRDLLTTVVSPDATPAVDLTRAVADADAAAAPESAADQRGVRAELFGRYVGQVKARIERAWLRPRSPIGDDLFECQVAIEQDRAGNVRSVTLQECNGDAQWQESLVSAISTASPLSAPPDASIFANTLTLTFTSLSHAAGASEDGFEPALLQVAQVSSVKWSKHDGILDLKITGGAEVASDMRSNASSPQDLPTSDVPTSESEPDGGVDGAP